MVKQITFYFGDSNLSTDKHLQKKVAEDPEGWVKLDHIASFKRMKSLVPSSDLAVIGNILKSSDQDTVEVGPTHNHRLAHLAVSTRMMILAPRARGSRY